MQFFLPLFYQIDRIFEFFDFGLITVEREVKVIKCPKFRRFRGHKLP